MLTATGLVESWDQTPAGPAVDERETLPIDLSGPHWDTPPLPEWIDPATLPPPPYTPLDGTRVAPLDGMRAFAVTAVILYHANPSWAVGGYFGVDVFFVLSGFLITTLLLGEWRGSGGVGLRAFWGRRARRLLPALFVMLAVVGTVSVLAPRVLGSPGLLGDTLATVGYVANWHFISLHTDYFATVANPSPLQHTWTLAIEEQFYLLWPLILLALVGGFRRLRRPSGAAGRRRSALVAGVALAGAVASALTMAVLTPVGATSVNRSYYGSDTRAQGLLIGAALAALCLWWGPVRTSAGRRLLGVVGLAGALGVLVMWRTVPESSPLTFHGGFALLALATAGVIACVTLLGRHPVAGLLSVRPLPYLGKISYGMYLWYWPVLLVMTSQRTHLQGVALLAARLAVIVGVAALSFHLVESPIHRGRLAGWRSLVVVPLAALAVSLLPLLMPSASAVVRPATVVPPVASKAALARAATPGPVAGAVPASDRCASSWWVTPWPARSGSASPPWPRGTAPRSSTTGPRAARWPRPTRSGCCGSPIRPVRPARPATPAGSSTPIEPGPAVRPRRGRLPGPQRHPRHPAQRLVAAPGPAGLRLLGRGPLRPGHHRAELRWGPRGPAHLARTTTAAKPPTGRRGRRTTRSGSSPTTSCWRPRPVRTPARPRCSTWVPCCRPGNQFDTSVGGVTARCADGVHMTVPGGELVGAKLLPKLVALGRSHAQLPHESEPARPARPRPAVVVLRPPLRDLSPTTSHRGPSLLRGSG